MALSSRTSRFFGAPSPGKTFADVATEIDALIKRSVTKGTDVLLASYSIGCDGRPTISLLDGSACDDDGDRIGLASRDRALLDGVLPRPMQSNNPGTGGISRVTVQEGTPVARYFVDDASVYYEGRGFTYHPGAGGATTANGTVVTVTGPFTEIEYEPDTGDVRYDWDYTYNGDKFHYNEEIYDLATYTWTSIDSPENTGTTDALSGFTIFNPCFQYPENFYSLEPYGNHGGEDKPNMGYPITGYETTADGAMRYLWLGRCSAATGNYRDVSGIMAEIAGFWTANGTPIANNGGISNSPYTGSFEVHLVFRDATTRVFLGSARLGDVESYCTTNFPTRCFTADGVMPWRAGIQVRPSPDGTWIVSVISSGRAWVYEAEQIAWADVTTGATDEFVPVLLETVSFPTPYTGVLHVVLKP